jgi:hypothetical protein
VRSQPMPVARTFASPLRADTKAGPHFIRILRHGDELEFDGEIVRGVAQELQQALLSNPKVTVIHLNSGGGDIDEARLLSRLIQDHGLITVTNTGCLSACTLAFLAGRERFKSPSAQIGFHRASNPSKTVSQIEIYQQNDRDFMLARGVPAEFVKKALSTPNSDIWIPTTKELKAANIITDTRGDFVMSGFGGETPEDRIDEFMAGDELFKAIESSDRERYRSFHSALAAQLERQATYDEFTELLEAQRSEIMGLYLPQASDAAVREFAKAFAELLQKIIRKLPAACTSSKSADSAHLDWGLSDIAEGELDRWADLRIKIVKDGIASRYVYPTPSAIASSIRLVRREFKSKYLKDFSLFMSPISADSTPGATCQAVVDFIETALSLPDSQPMPFLRTAFTGLSAQSPSPSPTATAIQLPPTGSSRSK